MTETPDSTISGALNVPGYAFPMVLARLADFLASITTGERWHRTEPGNDRQPDLV